MKNCYNCKFCKTIRVGLLSFEELKNHQPQDYGIIEVNDSLSGDLIGKCESGHTDQMIQYRKEHGNKTHAEIDADPSLIMECHEHTENVKQLDKMIELTDRMIKLLNTKKENTDPVHYEN